MSDVFKTSELTVWDVGEAYLQRGEDSGGHPYRHWTCDAKRRRDGRVCIGTGASPEQARQACRDNIVRDEAAAVAGFPEDGKAVERFVAYTPDRIADVAAMLVGDGRYIGDGNGTNYYVYDGKVWVVPCPYDRAGGVVICFDYFWFCDQLRSGPCTAGTPAADFCPSDFHLGGVRVASRPSRPRPEEGPVTEHVRLELSVGPVYLTAEERRLAADHLEHAAALEASAAAAAAADADEEAQRKHDLTAGTLAAVAARLRCTP